MPSGVYKRTLQHCLNLSKALVGRKHSKLEIKHRTESLRKSKKFKQYHESRKGKTFEELLGIEGAKKAKKKLSELKKSWKLSKKSRKKLSKSLKTSNKFKKYIREKLKGKTFEQKFGIKKAKRIKNLIKKSKLGKNNPMYGKLVSKKTRNKRKFSFLKHIIKNGGRSNFGKNETKLLNKQEKIDKCKIKRQHLIVFTDSKFVWLDGYNKKKNTVYEVYEKYHKKTKQHDLKRFKKIYKYLKCNFVIIYDGWNDNKIEKFKIS
jgi:hypothetical protein